MNEASAVPLPSSTTSASAVQDGRPKSGVLVECRICQEDDDEAYMEVPCSCKGSLKYAHRKCIQRWCDEKGDTICEICLQLMVLLVLHDALSVLLDDQGAYTVAMLTLLMLRTAGTVIPVYIILVAVTELLHRRRQRQVMHDEISEPAGAAESTQPQQHVITIV
nr:unnamed protein product [Digitaria exilis]